jgi:hypothetical protein
MSYNERIPVRTARLSNVDYNGALLRINYVDRPVTTAGTAEDASSPKPYCRLNITGIGHSGSNKLCLSLDIGSGDVTAKYIQYQFSAYATASTELGSSAGSPSSIVHAQCTTLGALITALNAIPGVSACRLHAPADYSLDTNDFLSYVDPAGALASIRLGPDFYDTLYKDQSEVVTFSMRVGVPFDCKGKIGRGKVLLHRIIGYANSASATDCSLKISRDPDEVDATKEVELAYTRYIPDDAITTLWDFSTEPVCEQGPLLIEVTAGTIAAATAWLLVAYSNAEL